MPLLVLLLILSFQMTYGWMKRKTAIGPVYAFLMLDLILWVGLLSFRLLNPENGAIPLLSILQYGSVVALPLFWLHFALDFAGVKGWKSPGIFLLTLVVPVLLVAVAAIGSSNGTLFDFNKFLELRSDRISLFVSRENDSLVWTWLHLACTGFYFLLATLLMIVTLIRKKNVSLRQNVILSLGIFIFCIGIFTFMFRFSPLVNLDISPYTFTLSAGLLAWGINYKGFLSIVLIARRSVVDRMIDGLIVLDSKNLIVDINSSAQKIFRIALAKVIGQPAEKVFGAYPDVIENLRYFSRKNQNLQIRVGNDDFYYLLDINPLFDLQGGVLGKMLVFQDITPLKLTEIKLTEAKVRAEQADNLKTAFLANMSHEIRTPMNAIIGFSNLLNDAEVSKEERTEFIEHIKSSGNSLLQLIDDIIDISKLDAGQIAQENRKMSITRLLGELFSYFNESLHEYGKPEVQLLVNGLSDDVDLTVVADRVKINRIMRHLLDNAVKFTTSGFIEFGVKMENPDVLVFYVQDSGIGIAREKQGMIFERFSRVMTGTKQEYGGTGLGLAICKGLTELMGGKIWVESSLGAGSTFYVSLPVTQLEEQPIPDHIRGIFGPPEEKIAAPVAEMPVEAGIIYEPHETDERVPSILWNSKVILVVEPEEMVYLNVELIVRPKRVNLFWAKSMQEAINFLDKNNQVNTVILSAQLDDATVEDSIHFIKTRLPEIPILAVVPFEGSSLNKICTDLGCQGTISKPMQPTSLLNALGPYMS